MLDNDSLDMKVQRVLCELDISHVWLTRHSPPSSDSLKQHMLVIFPTRNELYNP